jgi:hypothetical protein
MNSQQQSKILTSHSVAPPTFPDEMPLVQSPVGFLGSTGDCAKSLGSMAKDDPPNVKATLSVVVHGTVNPPCNQGISIIEYK